MIRPTRGWQYRPRQGITGDMAVTAGAGGDGGIGGGGSNMSASGTGGSGGAGGLGGMLYGNGGAPAGWEGARTERPSSGAWAGRAARAVTPVDRHWRCRRNRWVGEHRNEAGLPGGDGGIGGVGGWLYGDGGSGGAGGGGGSGLPINNPGYSGGNGGNGGAARFLAKVAPAEQPVRAVPEIRPGTTVLTLRAVREGFSSAVPGRRVRQLPEHAESVGGQCHFGWRPSSRTRVTWLSFAGPASPAASTASPSANRRRADDGFGRRDARRFLPR